MDTKKSADMSAAANAIGYSKSLFMKPMVNRKYNSLNTCIIVDVENLHKFIDDIEDVIEDYTVYAFIGENHSLADKDYNNNVIKILSPSTRKNGTDTCIQVYIGMLLAKEKFDEYIIATNDHYGYSLVEMISNDGLGWKGKPARCISKASQL
jgi:hypothetical protein